MSWFDRLKNLVDLDVGDISILDFTYVNVQVQGDDPPLEVSDEELTVDLGSIDEDDREEALDYVLENYEAGGEIFAEPTYREKKAIEATDRDRIDETLDFFRGKISNEDHRALEAALYLRDAWERDQAIESKKRDIVEKYGPDGRYIANLCTAGYFDQDRYFRDLYDEMSDEEGWQEGDYREVFEEIIANQPFTVFVSSHQSSDSVATEIRAKLRRYERYGVDVNFIDVRGIGPDNRDIIREAMDILEDDLSSLEYEDELNEGVSLVRIYPDSVSGLGDATLDEFM